MNASQQNMTCTTRFLTFIILHIFLLTLTNAQSYMVTFCQNSTEKTDITSYRSNVDNVLLWINSNSAAGTVSNQTVVHSSNKDDDVYGYYDCRGDITGSFCQFCLTTAVEDIAQRCPNGVTAMIWYDICIVGYSNQYFPGKVTLTPSWNLTGSKNVKDSTDLGKAVNYMRNLIGKVTKEGNNHWAMGEFKWSDNEKSYAWVQCSRDISKDGCKQCLETMLDKVPKCCGTMVKWAVVCPSCGMEIDSNKFYQLPTGSSSPLPNPGNINC